MNDKEMALWTTLDAWLGLRAPLLPNLQLLHIAYGATAAVSSWTSVTPLLNPSLQSFSLHTPSARIAEVLALSLLAGDVRPIKITYRGSPSKKAVQNFLHHARLECLKLSFDGQSLGPGFSIPIIELLNKLTHLKELQIDLRTFSITAVEDPNLTLPNLTILEVTGNTLDVWRLLQSVKFPSLTSLKLAIALIQAGGLRWGALCSCIGTGAPMLKRLSFQMLLETHIEFTPQDLELLSSLDLHYLRLTNIPHGLMRFDFDRIVSIWPNLRVLALDSRGPLLGAGVVIPLARHPTLRIIELPLDFTGFNDCVSENTLVPRSSPLTEIICVGSAGVPVTVAGTLMLVQSLLVLFPNLTVIRTKGSSDPGYEQLLDLQAGVSTAQRLLQNLR